MSNLTTAECNAALQKIRAKYDQIIRDFKKSSLLRENFEDRYIAAVRNRQNISAFLLGEIQAVEQLFKRESEKAAQQQIANQESAAEKEREKISEKSIADQLYEQNILRIQKYPVVDMGTEAADDISRLMGAVRILINDYYL